MSFHSVFIDAEISLIDDRDLLTVLRAEDPIIPDWPSNKIS